MPWNYLLLRRVSEITYLPPKREILTPKSLSAGAIRPGRHRSDCVRQQRGTLTSTEHSPSNLGPGSQLPLNSRRSHNNKRGHGAILTGRSDLVGNRVGAGRKRRLRQWTLVARAGRQKRHFVRRCNGTHQPIPFRTMLTNTRDPFRLQDSPRTN